MMVSTAMIHPGVRKDRQPLRRPVAVLPLLRSLTPVESTYRCKPARTCSSACSFTHARMPSTAASIWTRVSVKPSGPP